MERMGGSKQSLGSIASISKKQGRWREGKTNKKQGEGGRKRKQVILERAGRKDIRERKDEVGSKVKKRMELRQKAHSKSVFSLSYPLIVHHSCLPPWFALPSPSLNNIPHFPLYQLMVEITITKRCSGYVSLVSLY